MLMKPLMAIEYEWFSSFSQLELSCKTETKIFTSGQNTRETLQKQRACLHSLVSKHFF